MWSKTAQLAGSKTSVEKVVWAQNGRRSLHSLEGAPHDNKTLWLHAAVSNCICVSLNGEGPPLFVCRVATLDPCFWADRRRRDV
jgi:hypothetical protein